MTFKDIIAEHNKILNRFLIDFFAKQIKIKGLLFEQEILENLVNLQQNKQTINGKQDSELACLSTYGAQETVNGKQETVNRKL